VNTYRALVVVLPLAVAALGSSADEPRQEPAATFPHFRVQEIETTLGVGYGVLLVDVNADGRPDIVVADTTRVVWYENPTWKRHTILQGQTKPDNVCIAAYDIDGDGRLDLALGADWKGANPKAEGTIHWLRQGAKPDAPWMLHPIGAEPTTHRMRFVDLDGDGRPELVVVPLVGRHSSARNNWMDGPVRVLAYKIPKDPLHDRWVPEVLDESLHVTHNFWPVPASSGAGADLLIASYEGVTRLSHDPSGKWTRRLLAAGNQDRPTQSRGSSEIKQGHLKDGRPFLATIEPWHGYQVVVYTPHDAAGSSWDRHVLDEQLRWGHAVWCADLDGDGADELIVGVRDDKGTEPEERRGVRLYKALDGTGSRWQRHIVERGGVAVEDLAAADLNGDGRIDLVAIGRQTHNVRIYWNEGSR
jgi:hypothetical protein